MTAPFSIREAVRFGWEKTRAHSGLVFKCVLTIAALALLQSYFNAQRQIPAAAALDALVSLAQVAVGIGLTVVMLKLAKGEPAAYRDIIPSWQIAWRYVLASVVVGILVLLGYGIPIVLGVFALHSVPSWPGYITAGLLMAAGAVMGTRLMLRYLLVRFAAVDGVHRVGEILRISHRLTRGMLWRLFLFMLVVIGLNILGAAALLVGLLVSIPVTTIALAQVYLELQTREGGAN
jgi:hypothetical protein